MPALALRGIEKRFGTTRALASADCDVRPGTIHALLGENGAGKTTLMRIAFGLLRADAGEVRLDGAPTAFRTSADAIAAGIGMVHQHFMLVPAMTVAENVALGGHGRFDAAAAAARVRALGDATGLRLDPVTRVRDLPVGAQQRVEIVKALARDARLLIMDEPTAVLTPSETSELATWLRRFAASGGTVVLITHKLREALAVADDVTVLRRGRTVLAAPVRTLDADAVVAALVGEDAAPTGPRARATPRVPGEVVLALRAAHHVDALGITRLREADLEVRAGEILGVLGVEGAGQRELLRLLAGRLRPTAGQVVRPPRVGFVPEDRLADAIIPEMSLTENVALAEAGERRGRLPWPAFRERARALVTGLDIRTPGIDAPMWALSGGNQQKLVVGRERARVRAALVAENPTRGLDIRATARVREELEACAAAGAAVVFHSTDLEEVLAIADRVVVCFDGRVREVPSPADPQDTTPFARALVGDWD